MPKKEEKSLAWWQVCMWGEWWRERKIIWKQVWAASVFLQCVVSATNYWQFIPIKNVEWDGFWEKIHIRDNELDHVRDNELGMHQAFVDTVFLLVVSQEGLAVRAHHWRNNYIKINWWNLWPLSSHNKIVPESGVQLYHNFSKLIKKIPPQKNEDSRTTKIRWILW